MDSKWIVFRIFQFCFYLLIAFDEFVEFAQDVHPSNFRLSKFPIIFEEGLEWVPSGTLLSRIHGICCLLAVITALAPDTWFRPYAIRVAFCYNFVYWANAMDRYQHHYLLCLLLILLPWAKTEWWAKRLIQIQLAIVYFWTAVAKLADHGEFLDGDFLRTTARRREVYDAIHFVASTIGVEDTSVWSLGAYGVIGVELLLCALLLSQKWPWLAVAMGVPMHLGFEFVGRLSIGRFSWFMITLYSLIF